MKGFVKGFVKGVALGVTLVFLNRLCCTLFSGYDSFTLICMSGLLFFVIVSTFLISKNGSELMLCGITGLVSMFVTEIIILFTPCTFPFLHSILLVYVSGMYSSVGAVIFSIFMSSDSNKYNSLFRRCFPMTENLSLKLKVKLMIYFLISALGFSYLVMPLNAGISVPVFVLIQLICLWFIVPNKKSLLSCIPIAIISVGSFVSANKSWAMADLIVALLIFAAFGTGFDLKKDAIYYTHAILHKLLAPFLCVKLPFKWMLELNSERASTIKRVLCSVIIAVPCVILLVIILSSADMVFSLNAQNLLMKLFTHINFRTVYVVICGVLVGLYLFGILFTHIAGNKPDYARPQKELRGDLIIINILLGSLLFVYTLFVMIQFKYLFAGSALPSGLSYTEYARKGFFELLALSVVNIIFILVVTSLTKKDTGKWATLTRVFCHYMCAVTIVLLASSFYRMWLYTNAYGLTRMRFFVMGFLVFELIGLIVTFVFIARPKINITLVYVCLAITYYTLLSVFPLDNLIAKNQIDRYMHDSRTDLSYIYTLSLDAAPAMQYLYNSSTDIQIKEQTKDFLESRTVSFIPDRWQRFNLSEERAKKVLSELK